MTRERLREVMLERAGWDVVHISGHGLPAGLLLEREDGRHDLISSTDLVELLEPAASQLKLVLMSSCESGALTAAQHLRLLGIAPQSPIAEPAEDGGPDRGAGGAASASCPPWPPHWPAAWTARSWRCAIPLSTTSPSAWPSGSTSWCSAAASRSRARWGSRCPRSCVIRRHPTHPPSRWPRRRCSARAPRTWSIELAHEPGQGWRFRFHAKPLSDSTTGKLLGQLFGVFGDTTP